MSMAVWALGPDALMEITVATRKYPLLSGVYVGVIFMFSYWTNVESSSCHLRHHQFRWDPTFPKNILPLSGLLSASTSGRDGHRSLSTSWASWSSSMGMGKECVAFHSKGLVCIHLAHLDASHLGKWIWRSMVKWTHFHKWQEQVTRTRDGQLATSWKHKLINVGNGWIANKKLGWQHFWPEIVAFVISHPKIATKHVSWNRIHCISRHCCCDSTGWCWINPGASRKSTLPRRALCLECPIAGTHGTCRGKVPRTSGRQNWWMRSLSKICNGSTQTQISAALDLPCCMTVAENKPTNEPKCVT